MKRCGPQTMKERILIVADDFTGTLDTGIQFAKRGASTATFSSAEAFLAQGQWPEEQICAVNTNTRHMQPEAAYDLVRRVTQRALALGVATVYKKADSALRGNIGRELDAVLDVLGKPMFFAPAYPENGRTTQNGVQLVEGVPANQTHYGEDPFEPVRTACIPEILKQQSMHEARVIPAGSAQSAQWENDRIYVMDAAEPADLSAVARAALAVEPPRALAGCAGLAAALARDVFGEGAEAEEPPKAERLLIVSGSLSPIATRQVRRASKERAIEVATLYESDAGAVCAKTAAYQSRVAEWGKVLRKERTLILQAAGKRGNGEALPAADIRNGREKMADMLGAVARDVMDAAGGSELFVMGGDTLQAVAGTAFCGKLCPKMELEVGVPVSEAVDRRGRRSIVVSKSGTFGDEALLERVFIRMIRSENHA